MSHPIYVPIEKMTADRIVEVVRWAYEKTSSCVGWNRMSMFDVHQYTAALPVSIPGVVVEFSDEGDAERFRSHWKGFGRMPEPIAFSFRLVSGSVGVRDWCDENLRGSYALHVRYRRAVIILDDDRDAVAFRLAFADEIEDWQNEF